MPYQIKLESKIPALSDMAIYLEIRQKDAIMLLRCVALRCVALRCVALRCVALKACFYPSFLSSPSLHFFYPAWYHINRLFSTLRSVSIYANIPETFVSGIPFFHNPLYITETVKILARSIRMYCLYACRLHLPCLSLRYGIRRNYVQADPSGCMHPPDT